MKKKNKKELNYKKIAIVSLITVIAFLSIWLISDIVTSRRDLNSEILSLKQIKLDEFKSSNEVLSSYKSYKKFLKEYNISGNLTKKDFKRADYILVLETYSKDYEYEMKKFSQLSLSDVNGATVEFDTYAYCEDVTDVELIAYLIPVSKNNNIGGVDINVNHNYINDATCKEEE